MSFLVCASTDCFVYWSFVLLSEVWEDYASSFQNLVVDQHFGITISNLDYQIKTRFGKSRYALLKERRHLNRPKESKKVFLNYQII